MKYNVLILGASYGSLFAIKLLLAGHRATLVCHETTAELIDREGITVRFQTGGRGSPLEIESKKLPGSLSALAPGQVEPAQFDLIVLAMQEAQYGSADVRELMGNLAQSRRPCLALMNMPPLPYLKRIPGLRIEELEVCYHEPRLWDGFDPDLVTLTSPDPQAVRPPGHPKNFLQVNLATNFKAARFKDDATTALLRRLETDIASARLDTSAGQIEVPVKLKVHESLFVPLAKWPMLMAGNFSCIRHEGIISIKEAVHGDLKASRAIYDWVWDLCAGLGAADADRVPFEKYAHAALGLVNPSTAARALVAGARHIERVDCLIQRIARQQGRHADALDRIVKLVDDRLAQNRAAANLNPAEL